MAQKIDIDPAIDLTIQKSLFAEYLTIIEAHHKSTSSTSYTHTYLSIVSRRSSLCFFASNLSINLYKVPAPTDLVHEPT